MLDSFAKRGYVLDKNRLVNGQIFDDDYFEIPLEAMKVKGIDNLFAAGKIISATFLAQAALRIIPNCLSMGESLGKYIAKLK